VNVRQAAFAFELLEIVNGVSLSRSEHWGEVLRKPCCELNHHQQTPVALSRGADSSP